MRLKNKTNPKIRNYGYESRCPKQAVKNALEDYYSSYSTRDSNESRFNHFIDFHENKETGIKDLRNINIEMIRDYTFHINDQYTRGKYSLNTAHNYISAINNVMKILRGDRGLYVSAVKDAGLPRRDYIRTENRASYKSVEALLGAPNTKNNGLELLQRAFGLRFEESTKANAKALLKQAQKAGTVKIQDGTKGGQSRQIPITLPTQIEALMKVTAIQGEKRSLVDSDKSYIDFSRKLYRDNQEERFHDNRHAYAQDRYTEIAGADCPLRAEISHGKAHFEYLSIELGISIKEARIKDKEARKIISQELGHLRQDITNHYLG